jgi:hypothetical protein
VVEVDDGPHPVEITVQQVKDIERHVALGKSCEVADISE